MLQLSGEWTVLCLLTKSSSRLAKLNIGVILAFALLVSALNSPNQQLKPVDEYQFIQCVVQTHKQCVFTKDKQEETPLLSCSFPEDISLKKEGLYVQVDSTEDPMFSEVFALCYWESTPEASLLCHGRTETLRGTYDHSTNNSAILIPIRFAESNFIFSCHLSSRTFRSRTCVCKPESTFCREDCLLLFLFIMLPVPVLFFGIFFLIRYRLAERKSLIEPNCASEPLTTEDTSIELNKRQQELPQI